MAILDYRPPEKKPTKANLFSRILLGLFAGFVTAAAAIFLAGGFVDGQEGGGWGHFIFGCICGSFSWLLWQHFIEMGKLQE